ncbi:MAG: pilus assembly protein TadG-related protein [Terriglobales bacterium]
MRFRRSRGLTLPLIALMMVVFLLLCTLVVDLGIAYTARTSAQHAADAAALAGAFTLGNTPAIPDPDRILQVTKDAAGMANASKVLNYPVTVTDAVQPTDACDTGSNIICVDLSKSRVTAVISTPVDTYFGKITNWDLLQVKVKAVAESAPNAIGELCLKPFYIANDAISPLPPADFHDPAARAARCQQAKDARQTILEPNPDGVPAYRLTPYAEQYIRDQAQYATREIIYNPSLCPKDANGLPSSGCPFDFWNQTVNPSQYGLVDFSEGQGNGEEVLRCSIRSCMQECPSSRRLYQCGDAVAEIKTGNTRGQVEDPLKYYIGQIGSDPSNFYVDVGVYNNAGSTLPQSSSPSLISAIVWDCVTGIPNGTQPTVTVIGHARIFVNRVGDTTHQSTNAFLISAAGCGGGSSSTGPGAVPIRLVNANP